MVDPIDPIESVDPIDQLEQSLQMLLASLADFKTQPRLADYEAGIEGMMSDIAAAGAQAKEELAGLSKMIQDRCSQIEQERAALQQRLESIKAAGPLISSVEAAAGAKADLPTSKPVVDMELGQRLRKEVLKEYRGLVASQPAQPPVTLAEWDSWLEESTYLPPPTDLDSSIVAQPAEPSAASSEAMDDESNIDEPAEGSGWSSWVSVQPREKPRGQGKGWSDVLQ